MTHGAEESLQVERSGGFAGRTLRASVPIAALAPGERTAIEGRLGQPPAAPSGPDRFVYRFRMHGREAIVQEDMVPDELQPLLDRLSSSWA